MSALLSIALFSIFAHAESPFSEPTTERLRIDFISNPEWIEINRTYDAPEKLAIRLVDSRQRVIQVADFMQNGEASPKLVSIFKGNANFRSTLFVIVNWHYYLSGVDTEGDYYEVHAYGMPKTGKATVNLIEDRRLSAFLGSGFEGKKEGRSVHFRFKDAASVRRVLPLIEQGEIQKR